jgi:sugar/nucleoside kinase (ribokinase family)
VLSRQITTEISQVPLSGVSALLEAARVNGKLSMLDVDVPPSVAIGEAGLGSMEEFLAVMGACDVLKPTLSAAVEVLGRESELMAAQEVAAALGAKFGSKLVCVTDGAAGSGMWIEGGTTLMQPGFTGVQQQDATGAGDAFFGGLVSGIYKWGLPTNEAEMSRLARVASAHGAACCEVLGALPVEGSVARMTSLEPELAGF